MEPKEYQIMCEAEESHWWYEGMAAIMRAVVEAHYRPGSNLRILDAGCGTGASMGLLAEYGEVTGFDMSPHAIRLGRTRGYQRLAIASAMAIPFTDETFDLVTSLDVLYFVNVRDSTALQEFARVLMPGGRIIVRVPAFDWLRGIHDIKVSTGHRYTVTELSRKMIQIKLRLELMSYAISILFPMVVLKRLCERWLPMQTDSDIAIDLKCLGKLFKRCLILESHVITKWSLPFGLSIIAVGRKPYG